VAAILFYVLVYTLGLKRRTASNIVIGGAAGCFPVLVGRAAMTGTVGLPTVILFTVIFLWTPPHFWALAIKFKDDYAAAGVPMLPVVAAATVVARKILVYSWLTVLASLALARMPAGCMCPAPRCSAAGSWPVPGSCGAAEQRPCACSTGRSRTLRSCSPSSRYLPTALWTPVTPRSRP
jgi:protoheme IX farnesyltransferase